MTPRVKKTNASKAPMRKTTGVQKSSSSSKTWTKKEVQNLIKSNDNTDWSVKSINGHEYRAGYVFYLVEWKGDYEPSYEPDTNLTCEALLRKYHKEINHDPRKHQFYKTYGEVERIAYKRSRGRVEKRTRGYQRNKENDDASDVVSNKEGVKTIGDVQKETVEDRAKVATFEDANNDNKENVADINSPVATSVEIHDVDLEDANMRHLMKMEDTVIGRFPKYHLKKVVGYGTFGIVFSAVEDKTGKDCALKFVTKNEIAKLELGTMNLLKSFNPEKRFLCVPSRSFTGAHDGVQFQAFQMELLSVDLHTIMFREQHAAKWFPPKSVLLIMGQVFSAISFLNEKGYIYTDIKPENVMLQEIKVDKVHGKELIINPVVRLIDLNSLFPVNHLQCTCQTVCYRAPEVILGCSPTLDPKIDSWSMGILGIELLMKDALIDLDYEENEVNQIYDHISRIHHVVGNEIPKKMWAQSALDKSHLIVQKNQCTAAEVLEQIKPSVEYTALQYIIPRLLMLDPADRPTPSLAEKYLKDAIHNLN